MHTALQERDALAARVPETLESLALMLARRLRARLWPARDVDALSA